MRELSGRQKRIMEYIRQFWADCGYPPSIRDIASGCELSSTSVATYNLDILEKRGYIRRHREISRGLKLLSPRERTVPVVGTIAAGQPIPVPGADTWETTPSETIEVPPSLTGGREEVYALKVKGTSMIDALINDGDIVLMQSVHTVDNGEMAAVWLRSEREATLKKFYAEPGRIRLQPANSQMPPIYTSPDNVQVQGKVIAVIRQLA